jgi:hypothetical protein
VEANHQIEDAYRLTPLQQGMLFHTLQAPDSGAYLNQQSYSLEGELDVDAFQEAFRQVVQRHTMLRTAFVLQAGGEPRQVVHRHADLRCEQHDWQSVDGETQERMLRALLQSGRQQGFDLSRPPLMRLILIRRGYQRYHFVWRYHLMCLDGWSVAVILGEVVAIYDCLRHGERADLKPPLPFRGYIDWLEQQDHGRAEEYWQRNLRGFTTPVFLGRTVQLTPPTDDVFEEAELVMDKAETDSLRLLARRNQLTVNTVIQGAWALLLSRRSGLEDVVFGSVVSGRPVDLPGIESMVGLFINNLPVRVRVDPTASVAPWLRALQSQQAEARRYEYMSLVDIQKWSDAPRGVSVFEGILIFQNYPLRVSLSDPSRKLKMLAASSVERNSYPLTLVIEPGARLLARFVYDRRSFDRGDMSALIGQFRRLLLEVADGAGQHLSAISGAAQGERRELIDAFNQALD